MKNLFITLVVLILFIQTSDSVAAGVSVAENSAQIKSDLINKDDTRTVRLAKFLQSYNSPLAPFASKFVSEADKYKLDWRLVASIAGVESTFGKEIPYNSYNTYGWAGGEYRFKSWENSIEVVSKSLKEDYVDKGADSIWAIGKMYCPPNPNWAGKVLYFMRKIESYPLEFTLEG